MSSHGAALALSPLVRGDSRARPRINFVDVTRAAGINFQHDNAASPEKFLIAALTGEAPSEHAAAVDPLRFAGVGARP